MNFYITSGSMDFMKSLRQKYANENMVAMDGQGNSLLLHETTGPTLFQSSRQYDKIAEFGTLSEEGFFALHHIPVTDDGRPIFEHWMLSRIDEIEDEPGFIAYRLLRPKGRNTFIFLTEWSKKVFFELWQDSISYKKIIKDAKDGMGLDKKPHIFTSAPYIRSYKAKKED